MQKLKCWPDCLAVVQITSGDPCGVNGSLVQCISLHMKGREFSHAGDMFVSDSDDSWLVDFGADRQVLQMTTDDGTWLPSRYGLIRDEMLWPLPPDETHEETEARDDGPRVVEVE